MPENIYCFNIHIKNENNGSLNILVFTNKNIGKNIRMNNIIPNCTSVQSLDIIIANTSPNIQEGISVLYSKTPRNLLE